MGKKDDEVKSEIVSITVTRTIPPEIGGSGEEEVEDETIDVGVFQVDPARVGVSKGVTINTKHFSSARIDILVHIPCYKEEVVDALERVNRFVEAKLMVEAESVVKSLKDREAVGVKR